MLKRCEETNHVLNWEKCHFMVKEGIVLGHKVSGSGIEVDKAKFKAISKLPYPINVKAIRIFLGHAGFYRRFIKDFSQVARLMTQLLVKDAPFNFSEECIQAFDKLKHELTHAPIMIKPYWFHSKACATQVITLLGKCAENLAADHLSRLENLNLGKLTKAEIRDIFPEERLMAVSDKNNKPGVLTESYEGASSEMRQHKSFDNVIMAHQEGIMISPLQREKSLKPSSTGQISSAIHVDFMRPFPSSNGNKYILVAIDYVSKWVEAQAFPTNDARNVVNFLKRLFARFRIPKALISDRGDKILLFNSRLRLFPGKLKSIWYRPFSVSKDMKNGAIELYDEDGNEFIVNKQRVKPYQKDMLEGDKNDDVTLNDKGEVM
ncbi:reverse transcriptase domain-containing protein [Tanacetum coccineum]